MRSAGVPLVAAILRDLWNKGLWAVAACSFEEKLPRHPSRPTTRVLAEVGYRLLDD